MIAVIQRVQRAAVQVNGASIANIGAGLAAFVAVHRTDTTVMGARLATRLVNYRIFKDTNNKMNRSVLDIEGEILLISQFTLVADTHNGLRPGFSAAAPPDIGLDLFNDFVAHVRRLTPRIQTGRFGADMQVELINDGPATFILTTESEPR